MATLLRIGSGLLLLAGLLAIFLHPGFAPAPTVVGTHFPAPILLELALLSVLLYRHHPPFAQWFSRCQGDHQQLPCTGPDVTDLICTRLC
jgi:hypothetical protein